MQIWQTRKIIFRNARALNITEKDHLYLLTLVGILYKEYINKIKSSSSVIDLSDLAEMLIA